VRRRGKKRGGGFDPWRDREAAVEAALVAREDGATLRQAAKAAGVHVATLCRWVGRDDLLALAFRDAADFARRRKYAGRSHRRPSVPWRRDCPRCGAWVEVRGAWGGGLRFWRCSRWPFCPFASWRPRAPGDCPRCGGPWFWSHSRRSMGCAACGHRVRISRH
jgi:AcrR family transcriptional regulator